MTRTRDAIVTVTFVKRVLGACIDGHWQAFLQTSGKDYPYLELLGSNNTVLHRGMYNGFLVAETDLIWVPCVWAL